MFTKTPSNDLENETSQFLTRLETLLKNKKYAELITELDAPENRKYSVPLPLKIRAYRRAGKRREAALLGEQSYRSDEQDNSDLTTEYLWSLVSIKENRKALSIALDFAHRNDIEQQSLGFAHVFLRILFDSGQTKDITAYTSKCLESRKSSSILHAYRAAAKFEESDVEEFSKSIAQVKLNDLPPAHFSLKRRLLDIFITNFNDSERRFRFEFFGSPRFASKPEFEAQYNSGKFSDLLEYYYNLPDEELVEHANFFTFVDAATHSRRVDVLKNRLKTIKKINSLSLACLEKLRTAAMLDGNDRELLALSAKLILGKDELKEFSDTNYIFQIEAADDSAARARILDKIIEYQQSAILHDGVKIYLLSNAERLVRDAVNSSDAAKFTTFLESVSDTLDFTNNLNQVHIERNLLDFIYSRISISSNPMVSLISPIHRQEDLTNLKENFLRQSWPNLELIVVANGPLLDNTQVYDNFAGIDNVKIIYSRDLRIGGHLNVGIDASRGEIIMRFDSDDIYLGGYVHNNVLMLEYLGADVIGKRSYFALLESTNLLVRYGLTTDYFREWWITGAIAPGPSMVFRKTVFEKVRFNEEISLAEDLAFSFNVNSLGFKCVDIDPFNMIVRRRKSSGAHTWNASDAFHLSRAAIIGKNHDIFSLAIPSFVG